MKTKQNPVQKMSKMFVPPQVWSLGLRKTMETEEAMLDFIAGKAEFRMSGRKSGTRRNRKIYMAGKSPNLKIIFGGDELEACLFQEVVGSFLMDHHRYVLAILEEEKGKQSSCCSCILKGWKFLQMCAACFNICNLININNFNN